MIGLALVALFVVGSLVVREIAAAGRLRQLGPGVRRRGLGAACSRVITLINGIAEELFFRGAVYAAIPRHPVALDDARLLRRDPGDRQRDAGLRRDPARCVCGLQRRASGGVLAPILTHITWSLSMLLLLPLSCFR